MRSQVEAPIELWVAVIVMAASMALAALVIQSTGEARCIAELRSQTRELKMAMMDVAVGSPPTSREVTYVMPSCPGAVIEGLRFAYYTDPRFCTACPGRWGACWKVEPILFEAKTRSYRTHEAAQCVEVSGLIEIQEENCSIDAQDLSSLEDLRTLCPTYEQRDVPCKSELSPGAALKYINSSLTLAKAEKSTYKIRLTKAIAIGRPGEIGLIKICVT